MNMLILYTLVLGSFSIFASQRTCDVITENSDKAMHRWGTASRKDAISTYANRYGVNVIRQNVSDEDIYKYQYDFYLKGETETVPLRGLIDRVTYYLVILNNDGEEVHRIKELSYKVNREYMIQHFGNFEGRSHKRAMRYLKNVLNCSSKTN